MGGALARGVRTDSCDTSCHIGLWSGGQSDGLQHRSLSARGRHGSDIDDTPANRTETSLFSWRRQSKGTQRGRSQQRAKQHWVTWPLGPPGGAEAGGQLWMEGLGSAQARGVRRQTSGHTS